MRNIGRRMLQGAAVAAAIACCAAVPAAAHPHLCVSVEATVLYEKGAFTGVQQKWTFLDERFIAQAVEGLDNNNDGKFDRAELHELAKANVEGLKDSAYFTLVTAAGEPVELGEAVDYWLEHTEGALSLHFTVPFAKAVPTSVKAFELAVQDKENFIAFGLPQAPTAVRLGGSAPKGCRVVVESLEGEERETLKMILDALGCAIAVPRTISVACDGS